jgi:GT2 family glycosyltransferase
MRPYVQGKFIWVGEQKLYLRGVTYGTFGPGPDGSGLPERGIVARDFTAMSEAGINCVRMYTPPPEWLLDSAYEHGLKVLAGLPWEQHVAFLESRSIARAVERRVREAALSCAGHPALLGYAVGNEIPAPMVRWQGPRAIEQFIERLYDATKSVDPDGLVTYVNFPTTEYLELPFLDFACFNVFLEGRNTFAAYLARLHNIVGDDKPLVMAELGLDSRMHGEPGQAATIEWQLDTAFEAGCAGTFVFAWTDEWHRGGHDIEDWAFGIVDRQRRPKPALSAVTGAYERAVNGHGRRDWPRISVVVCSYNGERWLPGCLDALDRVKYPDWEVIVVSDGSDDRTDEIAEARGARLIRSHENRGLSSARNLGADIAAGEIVAYLDDDARPDPDWLTHLALAFEQTSHVGIGGPNLAPPDDSPVARCVASAPGGPVHVLIGDDTAEHIPGCNMALRRSTLLQIGGFDPRYRIAGDDVDVCWRVRDAGYTLGFSPAALVWHHRRPSVRGYLRQQFLYGKAEGLLHQKWPERYNRMGHLNWSGRVYGGGSAHRARRHRRSIRYGSWGSGLFQSIYSPTDGFVRSLPAMPEWYLLLGALLLLSALGLDFTPLLAAAPLLAVALGGLAVTAVRGTRAGAAAWRHEPRLRRIWMFMLTTLLHVLQPLARLAGRLRAGLVPWRRGVRATGRWPRSRQMKLWTERWVAAETWLSTLERRLRSSSYAVARGGDFDRWDLEVRGGALGVTRVLCGIEEHGNGKQLARFQIWPRYSRGARGLVVGFAGLTLAAGLAGAWIACAVLAVLALTMAGWALYDCAVAMGTVVGALERPLVPDSWPAEQGGESNQAAGTVEPADANNAAVAANGTHEHERSVEQGAALR